MTERKIGSLGFSEEEECQLGKLMPSVNKGGDGMSDEMDEGKILNCAGVDREKRNIMNERKNCSPRFSEESICDIDELKKGDRMMKVLKPEYSDEAIESNTGAKFIELKGRIVIKGTIIRVGLNVVNNIENNIDGYDNKNKNRTKDKGRNKSHDDNNGKNTTKTVTKSTTKTMSSATRVATKMSSKWTQMALLISALTAKTTSSISTLTTKTTSSISTLTTKTTSSISTETARKKLSRSTVSTKRLESTTSTQIA